MRVIALSTLKAFWENNPNYQDAREPCLAWYRQVLVADWISPAAVKANFGNASILKDGRVVFNIAGNKYRLVVHMLPEPTKRVRWLTRNEADRLIAELPSHLADMVRFSLETGLRRSNVTGLQWSQVDLVRRTAWIHPDQAKARKAIPVPLSNVAVLTLRKQIGKHQANVFTFNGKPVTQVNTKAWHKALRRIGIENFRWHDLRHTWASWHIQEGTPLHVLQELGGWSTPDMVQRYAHLSSEHLAQWVDRRPAVLAVDLPESGTFLTTGSEQGARLLA